MKRDGTTLGRTLMAATTLLVASGCAHGSMQGLAWGPVDGPMCTVRVQSGYDTPVELGASAGAHEVTLGVVEPGDARRFDVPCAYRAVTVFRVVRSGPEGAARLGAHTRALDARSVTEMTLRPAAFHAASRLR